LDRARYPPAAEHSFAVVREKAIETANALLKKVEEGAAIRIAIVRKAKE
jgi:uncharacterized protein YdaT